jgi:hypothetical protein
MKKDEFDFGSGQVVYWSFDEIVSNVPLAKQAKWELKEDLIQVEFGKRAIVDVGWYPAFDPEGSFTVMVIVDRDWEEPIVRIKCATIPELKSALVQAVAAAERMVDSSGN